MMFDGKIEGIDEPSKFLHKIISIRQSVQRLREILRK